MSGDSSNEQAISPTAAKDGLGRKSFRRPQKYHQGQRSDPTAFEALQRAMADDESKPPTPQEIKGLLDDNPLKVRVLRASGLSDEQIYDILNT